MSAPAPTHTDRARALERVNRLGLNGPVTRLLGGGLVSHFGNGMVYPFLLIYLHQVRGIELGTAGVVLAVMGIAGIASLPLSGVLADRFGALRILRSGLVLSSIGYALLPLVHVAWQAVPVTIVIGIGGSVYFPASSALLNHLVTDQQRHHAYAMQRMAMNIGFGLGGLSGGLIAHIDRPDTFTVVFLLDVATFVAYLFVVRSLGAHAPSAPPAPTGPDARRAPLAIVRGMREALTGRFARRLLVLDALIAVLFTLGFELMPNHATERLGQTTTSIGVLFLVNTAVVTAVQLPVSRALRGRRRMASLQLMSVFFAVLMATVLLSAGRTPGTAAVLLGIGACAFGVGEAVMGALRGPLQAEVAPAGALGRYASLSQTVWQSGTAITRAVGGFVLAASPPALWTGGLVTAGLAVAVAGWLGRDIPAHLVRVPR